ncbi:MAG: hypothetical protein LC109_11120 [Bacteroidia bacterium]|nr:hypothetical protein [Bacteroidia bacterium]
MKFPKLEPIGEILRKQPQKVGQVLPPSINKEQPKKSEIKEILQQTIYKEIDPTKYENPFAESEEKRAYNLKDLEALEAYFNSIELPQEIQLKQAERVCSPHLFIKSHIERCKSQLHTVSGLPFYNRLLELKTILEDNQTRTKAA